MMRENPGEEKKGGKSKEQTIGFSSVGEGGGRAGKTWPNQKKGTVVSEDARTCFGRAERGRPHAEKKIEACRRGKGEAAMGKPGRPLFREGPRRAGRPALCGRRREDPIQQGAGKVARRRAMSD